ncbi:hypothetical protein JW835_06085 [bacterium]|nr:hypothetical protein [bacterium]
MNQKQILVAVLLSILILLILTAFTQSGLNESHATDPDLQSRVAELEKKTAELESRLISLEKQIQDPPVKIVPCK